MHDMHYHGTPGEVKPCWCNQPSKGEPYGQVKKRARYMASDLLQSDYQEGYYRAMRVIGRLVESAPQQTLAALCEVLDPE